MTSVREAAVAGQFYPGNPGKLDATVRRLLDEASQNAVTGDDAPVPKAIIAPHAGYIYSGAVAAAAYARLAPAAAIKRVVLLGPCHRVPIRGLALSGADAFRTPLGDVPVDKDGTTKAAGLPGVEVFDAPMNSNTASRCTCRSCRWCWTISPSCRWSSVKRARPR